MAAIQSAIASWLNEAMRYGTCCVLVEGKRACGRNACFEDACVKVQLRITHRSLELEPLGPSVQLGELKAVEGHGKRPDEFIFRLAEDDVYRRLVTLRWNKTGRAAQYGEYAYVLFPTVADKGAFCQGMAEVQRFGVKAVLSGKCQDPDPNAVADPSVWQVQAGRERFVAAMKRWRGQRLWGEGEGNLVQDVGAGEEEAADEGQAVEPLAMAEDAEMHIRWAEALDGRTVAELSAKELRTLADGGLPLKYRHQLWPQWTADAEGDDYVYEDLPREPPRDVAHQISIDLPRTQPKWIGEREREVLGRVLSAYAVRNTSVGYCQGMNFIVMIFLLMGFDEAAAFRGLRKLVEDVCPGYHGLGLEGYLRDAAALGVLVHHLCPAVHRELETFDLPLNVLALDHFVSLAARVWPVGAAARLWDVVLLDGTPALFASFAAVLSVYLPRAVEEVKAAAAGSGKGQAKGKEAPPLDLHMATADVMDSFKKIQMRSILDDIDEVMERTRGFMALMPMSVIDKLRRELTEPPSPSKSR